MKVKAFSSLFYAILAVTLLPLSSKFGDSATSPTNSLSAVKRSATLESGISTRLPVASYEMWGGSFSIDPSTSTECISEAASAIGQEGVVSCKGNLRYPTRQIPGQLASSAANSGGAFLGSLSNSILPAFPSSANPNLANDGVWQCYQDGGPACYTTLTSVAMLSAGEGWAVGYGGILLHYLDGAWQKAIGPTAGRN